MSLDDRLFIKGVVNASFSRDVVGGGMGHNETANPILHYVRGGISSMVAVAITYPLNKLSMRQAMDGFNVKKAFRTIKKDGIGNLYKGLCPPLLQKSMNSALMFGTYFTTKNYLYNSNNFGDLSERKIVLFSGIASAWLESFLTPFERIQTLLTCRTHSKYLTNTRVVARRIIQSAHPMKEFYRGYTAVVLRNLFSTTLFFSAKECFMKQDCLFNHDIIRNKFLKNFVQGAVLGAVCSTMSYPINVTRFNMQRKFGSEYISFAKSLNEILEARNYSLKKFYSGAGINIVRSLISWGIVNSVYEFLRDYN